MLAILLVGLATAVGSLAGFSAGEQARRMELTRQAGLSLAEQFNLGVADLESGNYDIARQRFEFVLAQDPNFPGVTDKLAEAMAILYATATPTPRPSATATITATATRDLRPMEDLFAEAQSAAVAGNWSAVIDSLVNLRKEDPDYQVADADGLLYLALRSRGVIKILDESNLEGGIYDLTLAERFGPLDAEANQAREFARMYLIGSGFWEAYPERAVYWFGQVASAAPYLRDASGWTARERYRAALIQYGDFLLNSEKPCEAEEQYELALGIRDDGQLGAKLVEASHACEPPTPTATLTLLPSETPTFTPTVEFTPVPPTVTPTVPPVITDTPEPVVTDTPVPTTEAPPPVTDTPVPTTPAPPPATDTPVPTTEAPPPATEPPLPSETPTSEPTTAALPTQETPAENQALPTQAQDSQFPGTPQPTGENSS